MAEVSSVTFHYVLKTLQMKTKIPIEQMVEVVGLNIENIEKSETIKSYKLSAIFRYCMEKTNNPNLAFDIGQSIPYQSLGLLGYLLLNASNLKDMIEKFHTYQKLISKHIAFHFFEDEHYYKFAIYVNENRYIPVPSFHAEVHLSSILNILTQILGQKVIPAFTYLAYTKQSDSIRYEDVFGPNIYFEEDENAIFFKKDQLNIPVNNANPSMLGFFEKQANQILQELDDKTWFQKTEKEILKHIGDKEITIEFVASNLGLSTRTLQNHLKKESKKFQEALTKVRKSLTQHYFKNTSLDDTSISFLLGYSEVSSFYRAYKKWYGQTPKQTKNQEIVKHCK
jgi:AraC-like DNA-binding protein